MSLSLWIDIDIETTEIVVEIGTAVEIGYLKEILGDTLHCYSRETKLLGNMKETIEIENTETETEREERMEIKEKERAETEETGTETKEKNTMKR